MKIITIAKQLLSSQITLVQKIKQLELESANMRDALEYYNTWAISMNDLFNRDVAPSLWGRLHTALKQDAGKQYYSEMEQLRRQIIDLQEENDCLSRTNEFLEQTLKELDEEKQSPEWEKEAPATKPYHKKKGAA